jgi:hypothetical protein
MKLSKRTINYEDSEEENENLKNKKLKKTNDANKLIDSLEKQVAKYFAENEKLKTEVIDACRKYNDFKMNTMIQHDILHFRLADANRRKNEFHKEYSAILCELKQNEKNSNSKFKLNTLEECVVCMERYQPVYGLLCKHSVCVSCLINWFKQSIEKEKKMDCPLCKTIFNNFSLQILKDQLTSNMFDVLKIFENNISSIKD